MLGGIKRSRQRGVCVFFDKSRIFVCIDVPCLRLLKSILADRRNGGCLGGVKCTQKFENSRGQQLLEISIFVLTGAKKLHSNVEKFSLHSPCKLSIPQVIACLKFFRKRKDWRRCTGNRTRIYLNSNKFTQFYSKKRRHSF
jgi:hypothetical protein